MNKQAQETVITALSKASITYDEIRFSSNGKVILRSNITDTQTIKLAQAGIFSPLKSQAIKIWDTLGNSRETGESDIEYFVIFMADGFSPQAVFVLYPDLERCVYNAREIVPSGWTEDREEALLEAAIEIESGANVEEVVNLIIQDKYRGYTIQSIRGAAIRFKRDVLLLLYPLLRIYDE